LGNSTCNTIIKTPLLFALSKLLKDMKTTCVDIGCGVLPTPLVLSDICTKIYAYDIDSEALELYRTLSKRNPNVEVIKQDIETVEVFGNGRVGLVLALSILEHVHHPLKVLQALRRSMTRSGILIVALPWPTLFCRRAVYEDHTHRFIATIDGWIKLVEAAGFRYLSDVSRYIERIAMRYDVAMILHRPGYYLECSRQYNVGARVSGFLGMIASFLYSKALSQPCSSTLMFKAV